MVSRKLTVYEVEMMKEVARISATLDYITQIS